jgi:predicted nucleotidyltransferase/DNA-binding XRE family transcriptional regulator
MDVVGPLIREARKAAGLSQRELARRAGTSQPAVARYEQGTVVPTLATLERLLQSCGRRPHISTSAVEPVHGTPPALGGPGPAAAALRSRRGPLLAAAQVHGARNIRVFGSVARGESSPADVDLLVDLEPGRTLLDLAALRRAAAEILGVPVDVATEDMLKDRIRPGVLSQAVPL